MNFVDEAWFSPETLSQVNVRDAELGSLLYLFDGSIVAIGWLPSTAGASPRKMLLNLETMVAEAITEGPEEDRTGLQLAYSIQVDARSAYAIDRGSDGRELGDFISDGTVGVVIVKESGKKISLYIKGHLTGETLIGYKSWRIFSGGNLLGVRLNAL